MTDFVAFSTPEGAERRMKSVLPGLLNTFFEGRTRYVTGLSVGKYSCMSGGHPNSWGVCVHWKYVDRPDLSEFGPAQFIRHRHDGTSYIPQH